MLTPGLLRNLRIPARVKSHPRTGNRSGPSISFELLIAPVSSVDPLLGERPILDTPQQPQQTFACTAQIIETGMYLETGGREYPIKGVSKYPGRDGDTLYHLILEDLESK